MLYNDQTSANKIQFRGVAQLGSALVWGTRGRRFKSYRPDQLNQFKINGNLT